MHERSRRVIQTAVRVTRIKPLTQWHRQDAEAEQTNDAAVLAGHVAGGGDAGDDAGQGRVLAGSAQLHRPLTHWLTQLFRAWKGVNALYWLDLSRHQRWLSRRAGRVKARMIQETHLCHNKNVIAFTIIQHQHNQIHCFFLRNLNQACFSCDKRNHILTVVFFNVIA